LLRIGVFPGCLIGAFLAIPSIGSRLMAVLVWMIVVVPGWTPAKLHFSCVVHLSGRLPHF